MIQNVMSKKELKYKIRKGGLLQGFYSLLHQPDIIIVRSKDKQSWAWGKKKNNFTMIKTMENKTNR